MERRRAVNVHSGEFDVASSDCTNGVILKEEHENTDEVKRSFKRGTKDNVVGL